MSKTRTDIDSTSASSLEDEESDAAAGLGEADTQELLLDFDAWEGAFNTWERVSIEQHTVRVTIPLREGHELVLWRDESGAPPMREVSLKGEGDGEGDGEGR